MYRFPSDRKKILKISQFFPFFSEFHDKSGESVKNQESGRQHNKSGGLECLIFLTLMHSLYCKNGK